MDITNLIFELLKGLGMNILITFLVSLFPFVLGLGLSFLQWKFKAMRTVFNWLSLVTETICPVLCIMAFFYLPHFLIEISLSRFLAFTIALTLCFVSHMPARYVEGYGVFKNILYNGLDLISTVFKWSFATRILMLTDLWHVAENYLVQAEVLPVIIAIVLATAVIFLLEVGKRIVKQFMK